MAEEKKVSFSAKDDGVSSFMNKVRQDSKRMFDEQLSNAKKLTSETKDQIKFLKDYIEQLKIKSKLEKESVRGTFASGRGAAYGNIFYKNTEQGRAGFESAARTAGIHESAQVGTLKEMLNEMKKGADLTPQRKQSIFSEILKAGLLRDFGNLVSQLPGARNGLEGVTTMAGIAGAGTGALIGAPLLASAAGAQIGKSIGEFFGNAMTRHLTEQSRYSGAQGRLKALGLTGGVQDLSYLGLDLIQSAGLKERLNRSAGVDRGIGKSAAIMKAFGIDEGTLSGYYGGARMGTDVLSTSRLLGTARSRGVRDMDMDRVIQNQTQLTSMIAQSVTNPNAPNVAKSMFEFNNIGGPFSISDPRSMGLLSAINQSITNPSSPLSQAMNYSVLRRLNPTTGVAGLLEQQQQGISNRKLTSGILQEIENMGGSEDFKILATAQRFGLEGNIGAARKLFENRGGIGSMTDEDFKNLSDSTLQGRAGSTVPILEKNQAEITNAFVRNMTDGLATVASKFKESMEIAATEAAKDIGEKISKVLGTDTSSKRQDDVWKRYARPVQ